MKPGSSSLRSNAGTAPPASTFTSSLSIAPPLRKIATLLPSPDK
jgi:hypothetical protein